MVLIASADVQQVLLPRFTATQASGHSWATRAFGRSVRRHVAETVLRGYPRYCHMFRCDAEESAGVASLLRAVRAVEQVRCPVARGRHRSIGPSSLTDGVAMGGVGLCFRCQSEGLRCAVAS